MAPPPQPFGFVVFQTKVWVKVEAL